MKYLIFSLLIISTNIILKSNVSADTSVSSMPVQRIAENVYGIISPYYGRPTSENKAWNSNSFFVVTESGVLVFDTGSSEKIGRNIIEAIQTVTDKPIRWVVNSHSHADHWLGNAAFIDIGAEIYSTDHAVETMRQDGELDIAAFSRMTKGQTGTTRIAYPSKTLKTVHNFGGVQAEFIFSQSGHSPGDVLMWLPEQKMMFGGDVLNSHWLPIMTPRGDVQSLIATLKAASKRQPKWVLPGHGNITTGEAIGRDVKFLQKVWQAVEEGRNMQASSKDIAFSVEQKLGGEYQSHYKDFTSSIGYMVDMMYRKQTKLSNSG